MTTPESFEKLPFSEINNPYARLQKLYELSMTLSGDPIDVFKKVAYMIGEMFDVRVVCLSSIQGKELHFISVYVDGEVSTDIGTCKLSITPCSTIQESKDIRIYDKVIEKFPNAEFLKAHNAYSYCGFPALDSNGEVIAVTCILDDKPHEFTKDDQNILRIFGQRIAFELERQCVLEAREQSMRQNEILLQEIHHRVKNNLSVVISMIRMQAKKLDRGEEFGARMALEETTNRIHSMALIHNMLYEKNDFSSVDLEEYIHELTQALLDAYLVNSSIQITVDNMDIKVNLDQAIPCGLIINELVSNALRHAFPDNQSGEIHIILSSSSENGVIKVGVSDNGIGLPQNIDLDYSDSLGLTLVNLLTKQLNGELVIDRTKGTLITIQFSIMKEQA